MEVGHLGDLSMAGLWSLSGRVCVEGCRTEGDQGARDAPALSVHWLVGRLAFGGTPVRGRGGIGGSRG